MGTHGPEGTPGNFAWMDGVEAAIAGRTTPADVDTKITDERGAERAYQGSTYGRLSGTATRRAVGTRWVFMGDSITAGTGATTIYDQFTAIAPQIAGRQIQMIYNAGVGGNKSSDMLARFDADVLAKAGDTVHILAGTNDAGQAVPIATFAANIKAMVALAQAAGWAVILGNVPPRATAATAPIKKATYLQNLWLNRYCAAQNIPLVDYCGAMVDATTGALLAANDSGDGVHPSSAGHYAIGAALAATVAAINAGTYTVPGLVNTAGDPCNIATNPLMPGTPGATQSTGSNPWYFSNAASATFAILANDASIIGQWYSLAMANVNTSRFMYNTLPSNLIAGGDVLAFTFKTAVDNLVQPALADVLVKHFINLTDAAGANPVAPLFWQGYRPFNPTGPLYYEIVVPAGKVKIELRAQLQTTATATTAARLKIAQYGVYNLTQLGIAAL